MNDDEHMRRIDDRLRAVEVASSSFFPTSSRSLIRATLEAELRGLVIVPGTFPLTVDDDAAGADNVQLTLNVPQSFGPLVVTDIVPPQDGTDAHRRQAMRLALGSQFLDDGYWPAYDGLTIPRRYCGRLMSSPVVVDSGAQFNVHLDDPGVPYVDGEGCQVIGVGVGVPDRGLRQVLQPPAVVAAEWASAVRAGGQHYAISLEGDEPGTTTITTSADVVIECIVIAAARAVGEGEVNASDISLRVGTWYVTPLVAGRSHGAVLDADRVQVLPGLRWPVPFGSQITLQLTYPIGAEKKVRVTLLGRRGGLASGCWQ